MRAEPVERGRRRRRVALTLFLAVALGIAVGGFLAGRSLFPNLGGEDAPSSRPGGGAQGGARDGLAPSPDTSDTGSGSGTSSPPPRATRVPPEEPGTVLVAAIQFPSALGAVEENRKGLLALAEEAARAGAKLIVMPEAAVTGYTSTADVGLTWRRPGKAGEGPSLEGRAEPVPGPSTGAFGRVAKDYGAYIALPLLEHDAARNHYFNALVLMGPDGGIAAHYRKLEIWPRVEARWCTPGDRGLSVVETPHGRVGLMICYDVHHVLPKLAEARAEIVLHAVAWVGDGTPGKFERFLAGRAKTAGVALVSANWSVRRRPSTWRGYGNSCVLAPDGRVLGRAHGKMGSEIVYARVPVKP